MEHKSSENLREGLAQELQFIIRDAEALLSATASEQGETADSARAKMRATIERSKVNYNKLEDSALAQLKVTDTFVRQHPYESLGIALGIGAVLGLLLNRR
ncbi:MAG: DUF883 domain-containing protein [Verrucomicrobiota bacterium]|nr:DUF883 domain-containing protein [Verrucomicrobiota bacterium]